MAAGRPKGFDEDEVLDRAMEVFWAKGFSAASAEDLLAAMGIGKGSFYLAFKGGKRELYERTLERRSRRGLEQFDAGLAATGDPIGYLKGFFLALADTGRDRRLLGCYLGNALVEMAALDDGLRVQAAQLLSKLERRFREILRKAKEERLIRTREEPEVLAAHLINLWNGLNVTRRMPSQEKNLRGIIELNFRLLE